MKVTLSAPAPLPLKCSLRPSAPLVVTIESVQEHLRAVVTASGTSRPVTLEFSEPWVCPPVRLQPGESAAAVCPATAEGNDPLRVSFRAARPSALSALTGETGDPWPFEPPAAQVAFGVPPSPARLPLRVWVETQGKGKVGEVLAMRIHASSQTPTLRLQVAGSSMVAGPLSREVVLGSDSLVATLAVLPLEAGSVPLPKVTVSVHGAQAECVQSIFVYPSGDLAVPRS